MKRPSGSSLALLHACPASHAYPQVRTDGPAAARGRKAASERESLRRSNEPIPGYDPSIVWVPEVSIAYQVETQEAKTVPTGTRSADLGDDWIILIADALAEETDRVLVIDDKVKEGFEVKAADHAQLRGVSLAACRASGKTKARAEWIKWDPEAYEAGRWEISWRDAAHFDEWDLDVIADEIRDSHRAWRKAVKLLGEKKHPNVNVGPWCRYCPAQDVCHAKTAIIRHAMAAPASWEEELISLAPEQMGLAYARAKAVSAIAHRVTALVEEHARVEGVPLPDGRTLQLVEGKVTESVADARAVAELVAAKYGLAVALEAAEFKSSKAAVERAIRSSPGLGAKDVRETLDELRATGALTKKAGEPRVAAVAPKKRDSEVA